jgi:tRNA(Ile)-lysidine synthase
MKGKKRMPLLEQLRMQLDRLDRLPSAFVVAVSGGADSLALLRGLLDTLPDTNLIIAHLNHGLRGAESDADEQFVRQLHGELFKNASRRLSLRCERRDVAAIAQAEGGNLEAVARRERYRWLAQVASTAKVLFVATGHTADDQAETVLFRLLRGSGLQGLRGIAARRELAPGVELVRPLLTATRCEVLEYLRDLGQPFREDSSNTDLHFARNRIRHELLPALEAQYNPDLRSALVHLAEQAGQMFTAVEAQVLSALHDAELPRAGNLLILDRARLAMLSRNLLRELLRQLWQRENWPRDRMRFEEWDRLAGVALGEASAIDLPEGIRARCAERVVQIGPASETSADRHPD